MEALMTAQTQVVNCPICKMDNTKVYPTNGDYGCFECQRCGRFYLSGSLASELPYEKAPLFLISSWIRDQNERGRTPKLTTYDFERLKTSLTVPSVSEKQLLLMQALERRTSYPGEWIDVKSPEFIALAWCRTPEELSFHFKSLGERGLIETRFIKSRGIDIFDRVCITARGWDFLEANKRKGRKESRKVFVAMSFADEMFPVYENAIEPAIKETGYEPVRIDLVEHIEPIDDKILAEIKESKFLIADLTGHRNGVYFEAGFAMGLGIPVIWTVREDHADNKHFDIRQFNCIHWKSEEDLKEKLINRIKAVID